MFQDSIKAVSYVVVVMFTLALVVGLIYTEKTPQSVTQVAPIERIPQAIFISVCGELQGILVTTEPMLIASEGRPRAPQFNDLVSAAIAAKLAYRFDVACGNTPPSAPRIQ